MPRHPNNTNLILHDGSTFRGWPVMQDKGPFIEQYLNRLEQTMQHALAHYPRVFAFRVDLRLPTDVALSEYAYTNQVIERFIESLKAKIRHNRNMAFQSCIHPHDTSVRYVWAREQGKDGRPHYHLAILLNNDAFSMLGKKMFNRLEEAWASALCLPVEAVSGLVHISDNSYFHLRRDNLDEQASFFHRTSYLCKSATKVFVDGNHCFGCSRH